MTAFCILPCNRTPGAKMTPLFRKLDNLMLRVADLDAAIVFYRDKLGHQLLWRDEVSAGLELREDDAELVLHCQIGPETDIVVDDADRAFKRFLEAGGEPVSPTVRHFNRSLCPCSRPLRQRYCDAGSVKRDSHNGRA